MVLCSTIASAAEMKPEDLHITTDIDTIISIKIPIGNMHHHQTSKGDKIAIDDFGRQQIPGKPGLPTKIFSIAIPPGATFTNLRYTIGKETVLPGSYDISPVPLPHISNIQFQEIHETEELHYHNNYAATYATNEPYPTNIVAFQRTAGFRKYNLVDIQINPLTYQPQSGALTYYSNITVHIEYEPPEEYDEADIMYDDVLHSEQRAQDFILNYDHAQTWYPTQPRRTNQDGYVIITLDSLTSSIDALVAWEQAKGKNVTVVTTTWIDTHYSGYDLAEKMRNFLRDKYPSTEWGIQDVCLIGHYDDVPMRETWQDIGGGHPETDFYYAELSLPDNQSWDADSDHQYGENTDPIDYYAEVNVGRIPWSDPVTVQDICEKSVAYEQNNDPAFKNNILLLAAFIDADTDGATFMEYLANATLHPWMAYWMKTRLYEFQSPYPKDYILTHQKVVDVWSTGTYAFVSWHAHGSPQGTEFISVGDCQYLNDDYPAIISAASCSNADTNYLNIGQAMMKQGAVGFLGANKVAYYRSGWDDPNDGSDQSIKYFFKQEITAENKTQGQAHQYAISKMYQQGLWINLKYETFIHGSLWGNPDLGMWSYHTNDPPSKPTRPTGPTTGEIRVEHTYTSSTTDPDDDNLYYLFNWDDGTNSGWLGPYSPGETVEASHTWTIQDTYEITVIAQDSNGTKSIWSDPLPIEMPHNTHYSHRPFIRFLQNHPHLFPILQAILQV
jgi:hypothetical protein